MKKELLLIIGPLLLLSGCGIFKKKTPLNKKYAREKRETEVFTESVDFEEEDGSVRSFFNEDENVYYTQSDFDYTASTFIALGDSYDDTPLSVSPDELDEEESQMALDIDYEV